MRGVTRYCENPWYNSSFALGLLQAAYEHTKTTVTRWQPLVKANREAPHLSFSAEASENTRHIITTNMMMDAFKPSTPLELEMAATFRQLSQAPATSDGLPEDATVSFDEFCKRQSEMAKLKALMSYHDKVNRRAACDLGELKVLVFGYCDDSMREKD